MKTLIKNLPFIPLLLLMLGCTMADPSEAKYAHKTMWTKTNLRIYGERCCSWKNEDEGVILPVGTEVTFLSINSREAIFVDENVGLPYTFYWQGSGPGYNDYFDGDAHKYFTDQEPVYPLSKFTPEERELIKQGIIKVGMSKEAALISRGWPYESVNPMEEGKWVYRINYWERMTVLFEGGKISAIYR